MISYFDYKLLKEETPPPADSGGSAATPPSNPVGLPSPSTGALPGGLDLGGSLGGPSAPMGDPMGGPSMDVGNMGATTPTEPAKAFDLKFSNVWDAFEELLKKNKSLHKEKY